MKKQLTMAVAALAAAFSVTGASAVTCTTTSFTITAAAPTGTPLGSFGPNGIEATKCIGVYAEPNNVASILPAQPNLGYLNSGLLNGQGGWVNPTEFIDQSRLQDLNPATAGQKKDPGWIQLGMVQGNAGTFQAAKVTPVGGKEFDLGKVLSYKQEVVAGSSPVPGGTAGTWTLTVDADIVNILHANGLFQRSSFDQLAFEVKAGSNWAVYDFDFTKFGNTFDLNKAYTITGTWNLNDFPNPGNSNGKGKGKSESSLIPDNDISDLILWARDPVNAAEAPEPGSMALMGLGLLSLAGLRRRRHSK
jgi:hypothetical protein